MDTTDNRFPSGYTQPGYTTVYIVIGECEARSQAWFEILETPHKEWIVFEHSGHRLHFEEPGTFAEVMRRVVAESTQ